jgi:hypothetical protein
MVSKVYRLCAKKKRKKKRLINLSRVVVKA